MGMFTEIVYEVDLRDRETGNSVETIYSGTDSGKAYGIADEWNIKHGLGEIQEDYESYDELLFAISPNVNPQQKLFADVYHVETSRQKSHGVGKYN